METEDIKLFTQNTCPPQALSSQKKTIPTIARGNNFLPIRGDLKKHPSAEPRNPSESFHPPFSLLSPSPDSATGHRVSFATMHDPAEIRNLPIEIAFRRARRPQVGAAGLEEVPHRHPGPDRGRLRLPALRHAPLAPLSLEPEGNASPSLPLPAFAPALAASSVIW
jgi:hypothetical protein